MGILFGGTQKKDDEKKTTKSTGGLLFREQKEQQARAAETGQKRLQMQESRLDTLSRQTTPQPKMDSRMQATAKPEPFQSIQTFQSSLPKVEPKLETGIPIIDNVVDWYDDNVRNSFIGKAISGAEKADRAVSNFKAGAMDTATFGITQGIGRAAINSLPGGKENLQPIMDDRTNSTSYKVGEFAGYLPPGAAIESGVAGVLKPVLKNAGPVLRGATTTGIAGLAEGTVQEMGDDLFRNETFTPSSVIISGAAGAGLGAGLPLLVKGARAITDKIGIGKNLDDYSSQNQVVSENSTPAQVNEFADFVSSPDLNSTKSIRSTVNDWHHGLWDKVQRGDITDGGAPSAVLQVAKLVKDNGGLNSIEDLISLSDEVHSIRNNYSGTEYQDGLNAIVQRYSSKNDIPSKVNLQAGAERPPETIAKESLAINATATEEVERKFTRTLLDSEKPPEGFKERLKSAYKPITNQGTIDIANARLKRDIDEATSYALGNERFSAEKAAVAQRLIDHYNGQGNYQRAVDIAQKVSEEATKAGQSIQALSMFNRLTPEGVLIHAQRLARKTNERLLLGQKEVKVTAEIGEDITGLANATRKMTGVQDLSNDVESILDRAKAGEKLTDTDTATLRRFVQESKQFVKEVSNKPKTPRAPRQPKDKRVREKVVSFLDAQEQAAKERLRSKGIRVSSTPLDIWADYAIIGAAKMGKGAVKFADWSEQMVKDLGEGIRPNLENLYERSRETFESSTKKVSLQTVSQAEKLTEKVIKSKELSGEEAEGLRKLARQVSSLSGDAKRAASQDLQVILQTLEKPSLLKRVSSVQTIGQLLNPKTQVRNALGNELFYRLERLNKLVATPIDIARSKITRGERTVTFRTNNQGQYWANWMRGLKAGWKGTNVNGIETQYDLGSPAFKSKYNPLTYMEKSLGAALKSFDTASYMRAYNNTIGELATLRAVNEGVGNNKSVIEKYIREADDNMMKIADQYGKYVTMQDNNLVSRGLVGLKRGLNFKQDFGIGDLVLKYPKTPGNLLMRALEYSPAGVVRSLAIAAKPLLKREASTAEATQAMSRAIIGTGGLSILGYLLLDKGILTGSASKDRDIRDLQKATGQGQYQVNLSALIRFVKSGFDPDKAAIKENDYLYTYDWMQPISIAISMGANVKKNNQEGLSKLSGTLGTAYNSLEGGLGTLTEQSVLSGIRKAAEGYPGQTITDKIMDILSDIPSSFVPTFSNQINQLRDNNKRETYSPSKLDQSLNKAKAKIPGLAQSLPRQYNTLGEPKEAYQDNNLFNVMFNPGNSSRYKLSPEAEFIVDLINESGDEALAPRAPSKSITIDGQSVKLDGDMYSRFQQLQGEEMRNRIGKISPNAPLKTRVSKTEKALDKAGEKARDQLKKELGSK